VWTPGGTGDTSSDCVFPEARCFIFTHWWSGAPVAGDIFTFEADPTCTTVEMPVMFDYDGAGALPSSVNHVNSLVDGNTVITGRTYGPSVDYLGAGAGDILADYVAAAFQRAGCNTVIAVDSTAYHFQGGDIHCGTNVKRVTPSYNWWEK